MPGKTLVEKGLSHASGREVRAGDITIARVDLAYVQDGTGPLTFRQMEKMGLVKAANPARSIVFIDHSSPPPRTGLGADHGELRGFAARPGEGAIGADSHTGMGGAMGAFATGMGSTDVAVALALGKTWLRVPESWRFEVTGAFPRGGYAKDLILRVIGDIKTDGATYMAMEWGGPAISSMPMTERMVLSNMAIEAGGKCGPQPSDAETRRYLKEHGREGDWEAIAPDPDARYEKASHYDASSLEPMVARPPQEDNVVPATDPSAKGVRVHAGD